MHHKTLVTAIFAATALATPLDQSSHEMKNSAVVLGTHDSETHYTNADPFTTLTTRQRFSTAELRAIDKDKDLRCQLIDWDEQPIPVKRGITTDRTFGDGGYGKWTFAAGDENVSKIVCDPSFRKIVARGSNVEVVLHGDAGKTVKKHFVDGRRRETETVEGGAAFSEVELHVGPLAWNQELRCELRDADGEIVMVEREGKHSLTFGDGSKGPWKFTTPNRQVVEVTCAAGFEE